ncbi:grpE protein homolog 2, mitochondrial-like isoform X2 [Cornus florida]|uniref:grpE protein homolog 2, mitochondrial-like isoform X2 n=1 Tax=Cornus florida TaxID=4283 RepID=UPI00289D122E|nr:grpE protein homolog 2, mitochondrial-like isoform X2 [Cornus florida]
MLVSRVSSRLPKGVLAQCRNSLLLYARRQQLQQHHLPILSNQFHSLRESPNKVSVLHHSIFNTSAFQRYGISSSASPLPTEKDNAQSRNEQGDTIEDNGAAGFGEAEVPGQKEESDSLANLSIDDLSKLVAEKEELLKIKHKEMEKMQDKVLRSYAEMENVMDRTKREAESSKKFAVQNFAKSLLDVADNLGRAASVVKGSFSKIDTSTDSAGAVPLLKTLLEGVEMTDKQLAGVFKKFGVEKFDPTNEQFDPHKHNAVFQVPDATRPPETVAVVLKSGYMLYDRVIRPAEVGVTVGNRMVD